MSGHPDPAAEPAPAFPASLIIRAETATPNDPLRLARCGSDGNAGNTLAEIARRFKIRAATVRQRVCRCNWPPADICGSGCPGTPGVEVSCRFLPATGRKGS